MRIFALYFWERTHFSLIIMHYKEYKSVNYAAIADEILEFWKQNKIFEQSIEVREGAPTFTFFEGPPSANGTPGIFNI